MVEDASRIVGSHLDFITAALAQDNPATPYPILQYAVFIVIIYVMYLVGSILFFPFAYIKSCVIKFKIFLDGSDTKDMGIKLAIKLGNEFVRQKDILGVVEESHHGDEAHKFSQHLPSHATRIADEDHSSEFFAAGDQGMTPNGVEPIRTIPEQYGEETPNTFLEKCTINLLSNPRTLGESQQVLLEGTQNI